ncbi:MAG: glycosyltransferase family 2 protein [Nitrospirae bacterium]|nr:glycosyltransferase family 2 protein [Nitrospirota bacterium]
MRRLPFITIIIPCRNEEKFISTCLKSIIASDYPKDRIEVLVVDGMSEDGTRAIIDDYVKRYAFIRLIDNPRKITPTALNTGITNAKGEIIIRMDAHAKYPPHYVSTCMKYLDRMDVDVVGGPVNTEPGADTLMGRSIALATSHPFGVGNSKFRASHEEGCVDTVPFGAYRREVFDKVGLFDERLVRNQDNELSSRIINKGGRIYLTPELLVTYYNQATLKGLLKQALITGMWNVVTIRINPASFRWRHFVPFIFVTALLALGFLAPLQPGLEFAFLSLVSLYGGAAGVSSLQIALREGAKYIWVLPVIFFLYHVCYGIGTWVGLLRMAFSGWGSPSGGAKAKHRKAVQQGGDS